MTALPSSPARADHRTRCAPRRLRREPWGPADRRALTWEHRGPIDRLIAALAMIESVPVVTANRELTGSPASVRSR